MNPSPMNRALMVNRLRWPALLLLTGVIALLDQAGILSWGRSWPLYLILLGVLALAERMAMTSQPPIPGDYPAPGPYSGPDVGPNPGSAYPASGAVPVSAQTVLETRASFPGNSMEDSSRTDESKEDR